jgi:hypothetical protein
MEEAHPTALRVIRIVRAGVIYFAVVFGAGFVLGTLRVTFLLPRIGTRAAELIEAPFMLAITFLTARWLVKHFALQSAALDRIAMGLIGLALMLAAEFGFVLWLRSISIAEYFATRDPVSGTVYYILLGVFALMPLLARHS